MSAAPMHSIANVLPAAMQVAKLVCRRCGNEVSFAAKQWRQSCRRCGLVITRPRILIAEQQDQEPACFICTDRGLVFYQEQQGRSLYEFAARCTCRAGQQRSETGLPQVDQVDNIGSLNNLARQNRLQWQKRTGRRAGTALLTEAAEVPAKDIPF